MKKSDREIMEILEAFDATASAHSAVPLTRVDPKTVRRYVGARDAGRPVAGSGRRPRIIAGSCRRSRSGSSGPGARPAPMSSTTGSSGWGSPARSAPPGGRWQRSVFLTRCGNTTSCCCQHVAPTVSLSGTQTARYSNALAGSCSGSELASTGTSCRGAGTAVAVDAALAGWRSCLVLRPPYSSPAATRHPPLRWPRGLRSRMTVATSRRLDPS